MLEVMNTISVNDEPLTLFGQVFEESNSINMNYQIISKTSGKLDLLHHPAIDLPLISTTGKAYMAYNCKFVRQSSSIIAGNVHLEGSFDCLVEGRSFHAEYDSVVMSFAGIEKFFSLQKFTTIFETENEPLTFCKEKDDTIELSLTSGILCEVRSEFTGVHSSSRMYEIEVKQRKSITLHLPQKVPVNALLSLVWKTKQYFEFIANQEIQLSKVEYFNKKSPSMERGKLICDSILQPKTFVRPIKDRPYNSSPTDLLKGLDGWLTHYDPYCRVLEIWQKTIYNQHISKDDIFLWKSQAFELLCTIDQAIFAEANTHRAKGQSHPNLKNFLTAVKKLHSVANVDSAYFKDVKETRDVLTHNNPSKSVSENQKKNAYNLIDVALHNTLAHIFGIVGSSVSICLGKPGV